MIIIRNSRNNAARPCATTWSSREWKVCRLHREASGKLSRWLRTTLRPAAKRIAAWSWLFQEKSSASKSACPWRPDDNDGYQDDGSLPHRDRFAGSDRRVYNRSYWSPARAGVVSRRALADAYRGRGGRPCSLAIRCGCRLDKHIFRRPRFPVALAGVVRVRRRHASVRVEPRPHVGRFKPRKLTRSATWQFHPESIPICP